MPRRTLPLDRRTLLKRTAALTAALAAPASAGRSFGSTAHAGDDKIEISFANDHGILEQSTKETAAAINASLGNELIELDAQNVSSSQYLTRLALTLAAGRGPDVFNVTGAAIAALADPGAIEPLDDYLATWPAWEQFPELVRGALTYKGKIWALPYIMDTHFLYYRTDLFQKAGLPVPWTPASADEILTAANTIKSALPDVIPYVLYAGQNGGAGTVVRGFAPLNWSFGGDFLDPHGKWIIDSCGIRSALGYYERAYRTDEVVPQTVVTTPNAQDAMRKKLGSGEAAILFDGSWCWGGWDEEARANIGYTLFPASNGAAAFTVGGLGACWFMNAKCDNKQLAWQFMTTWNTPELVASIVTADPHAPARNDAAAILASQNNAFLIACSESLQHARLIAPNPAFQDLIGQIQDATGKIATGKSGADEAIADYESNLKRILGEDNAVALPC